MSLMILMGLVFKYPMLGYAFMAFSFYCLAKDNFDDFGFFGGLFLTSIYTALICILGVWVVYWMCYGFDYLTAPDEKLYLHSVTGGNPAFRQIYSESWISGWQLFAAFVVYMITNLTADSKRGFSRY